MAEALTFDDLLRFHRQVLMPEIGGQIEAVRSDLGGQIEAVRSDLGGQIEAVRSDLGGRIEAIRGDLGGQIEAVRIDLREETGTIRTELARHVTAETGSLRTELQSFRREFDDFRGDVLSHFDAVYQRLASHASESVALKAGIRRLEEASAATRIDLAGLRIDVANLGNRLTDLEHG
ncbi:MAG TPA: hypothetical protein VM779_12420 [Thermoanaerobaculia bacterium]|nr:hypothetical protein [Thermoanaerobaculia bacterium]